MTNATARQAYADLGPTLPSTFSAPPAPPKPRPVPPQIGRIIGELGLRYRPSVRADIEAHAESLRLLAMDLSDMPPGPLERAAQRWVREQPFMPKASDLVALARDEQRGAIDVGSWRAQLQAHCDRLNQLDWCAGSWRVIDGPDGKLTIAR